VYPGSLSQRQAPCGALTMRLLHFASAYVRLCFMVNAVFATFCFVYVRHCARFCTRQRGPDRPVGVVAFGD
jgi:hypothetical protein